MCALCYENSYRVLLRVEVRKKNVGDDGAPYESREPFSVNKSKADDIGQLTYVLPRLLATASRIKATYKHWWSLSLQIRG